MAFIAYEVAFFRSFRKSRGKLALLLLCFGVLLLIITYLITNGNLFNIIVESYGVRPFTLWQRLITEPYILLRYLFLLAIPVSDFLVYDSDIVPFSGLFDSAAAVLSVLATLALALWSIASLRRTPLPAFAILFYFLGHIVESSFIGLELYFEHRNYLPSVFLYLVFAYYALNLCDYYRRKGKRLIHALLCLVLTFFLMSEAHATLLRNDVWKDSETLLIDNVGKAPENMRSWFSLGAVNIRKKQFDRAEKFLNQAQYLKQRYPDRYQKNWVGLLYYNIGILALHRGESTRAIEFLKKSIEVSPGAAGWNSYFNLGFLYFKQYEHDKAEDALRQAHRRCKELPEIYNFLGRVLYANNKLDESINVFQDGLEVEETIELRLNLIAAYIKKGDLQGAKKVFLEIYPDDQDTAYNLFRAYLYPGPVRTRSLRLVASQKNSGSDDFRSWLGRIDENHFPGIIYPDIVSLEEQLILEYEKIFD